MYYAQLFLLSNKIILYFPVNGFLYACLNIKSDLTSVIKHSLAAFLQSLGESSQLGIDSAAL